MAGRDGMSKLKVCGDGLPGSTTVHLDGRDIAPALQGLKVSMSVGEAPTAELDVLYVQQDLDLDGVRVLLPTATRDLLVSLGWTPPQES